MTNSYEPVSTFNKGPFCLDHFELCNFKRVGRKQQILSTTFGKVPVSLSKILSFGSISIKSQAR
jgi:hypothetical protein